MVICNLLKKTGRVGPLNMKIGKALLTWKPYSYSVGVGTVLAEVGLAGGGIAEAGLTWAGSAGSFLAPDQQKEGHHHSDSNHFHHYWAPTYGYKINCLMRVGSTTLLLGRYIFDEFWFVVCHVLLSRMVHITEQKVFYVSTNISKH